MSFERLFGAAERAIERFSSPSGGAALEAARQRAEQAQAELYDGSVPPWQTLSEQFAILEEELKARILALSAQQSLFTTAAAEQHRAATRHRSVLPGCLPMATAALEADPQLAQLRFRLVPRRLSEEDFWQVYFWHVATAKLDLCNDFASANAAKRDYLGVSQVGEASAGGATPPAARPRARDEVGCSGRSAQSGQGSPGADAATSEEFGFDLEELDAEFERLVGGGSAQTHTADVDAVAYEAAADAAAAEATAEAPKDS